MYLPNKPITALCIAGMLIFSISCKRQMSSRLGEDTPSNPNNPNPTPTGSVNDLVVPPSFNFNTVVTKQIDITVLGLDNNPAPNVGVFLMDNTLKANGNILAKGVTNNNGVFSISIDIPTYYKKLVLNTTYGGAPQNILLNITAATVQSFTIGGANANPYATAPEDGSFNIGSGKKNTAKFSGRLGGWNLAGTPNFFASPNDFISPGFFAQTYEALPEKQSLPLRKNEWLDDNQFIRELNIIDNCELFVSFMSEGSALKNTLFYYTYPTGVPPTSLNDIDSLIIVFPNSSFNNSGGALISGQRISLGNFSPGTTVAYGLVVDGWKGGSNGYLGITNGNYLLFANKHLNPETNPAMQQHTVMLHDAATGGIITAFEESRRDIGGSDNDFNDVIFLTTALPSTAIDITRIAALPPATDSDADGVFDNIDDYPFDNERAFDNFYPAANRYASVMFEDTWPVKGDFDMNDVVVDYRYKLTTDGQNRVKDVEGRYILRASGSETANAFAVEFPMLRANVTNFGGGVLEGLASNAIVRIFANSRVEMAEWNTKPELPKADSVTYTVKFSLIATIPATIFGLGEYNPFIWSTAPDKGRGYEIHLPGKPFTNLADPTVFGTADDNTQASGTNTYKTKNNLFWALSVPQRFEYATEKTDLTHAYLKFGEWAVSGGTQFPDWYKPNAGYKNLSKIYTK